MGDRTWVRITVRKSEMDRVKPSKVDLEHWMEERFYAEETSEAGDNVITPKTYTFQAQECNYANWDEFEAFLKSEKIPFDKSWGAGCAYPAGEGYTRYTDKGEDDTLELSGADVEFYNFFHQYKHLNDADFRAKFKTMCPDEAKPL